MWPKKNTAFVVIHGAGPHDPFETLDAFVRGFWDVVEGQNQGSAIRWHHKLQRHKGWIENYISLAVEGRPALDFYEYYWDSYMDHNIDLAGVLDWLDSASEGAEKFYQDRPKLVKKYEELGVELFKDGDFKFGSYLILLGRLGRVLRAVPVFIRIVEIIPGLAAKIVKGAFGDVVIYTESDFRSRNYVIRQRVLGGAVEELRLLLENDDYERIVVVGHSLGSLIAYDALNRINHDMNVAGGIDPNLATKIVGLVTFGSPLDKIAFFFREGTPEEAFARRQLLAHFHGFKSLGLSEVHEPVPIDNPIEPLLDKARWLNFYHPKDQVAGPLDAYDVDRNILCDEKKVRSSAQAHEIYWEYDPMYEDIAEEFFH